MEVDQHPLPKVKPEKIFTSLATGQHFTTLDLSQAYQQLVLDDASRAGDDNTHQGLYRCMHLLFGVASAPTSFQRMMDEGLHELAGVMCCLDDLIVTSLAYPACFPLLRFHRFHHYGKRSGDCISHQNWCQCQASSQHTLLTNCTKNGS